MDVDFLNFCNQQKYMIIGFHLIYNFNLSWLKHNYSRGYKLLHVFWNTLYMYTPTLTAPLHRDSYFMCSFLDPGKFFLLKVLFLSFGEAFDARIL